jgi:hypothetical protein
MKPHQTPGFFTVRGLIPYVAGWAMMGFVIGLVWWLIGRVRQRPYS